MIPGQKAASLEVYVNNLKNRLTSPPNEKHKNYPEALKAYLQLEITKATRTIERIKTQGK